jgi:hypothetical protein
MSISPISGAKADLPARPLTQPVAEATPGYGADQFVTTRTLSGTAPSDKAWIGLQTAGKMLPVALERMWQHRGQVAKSVFDAYLHPIRSLDEANQAYRQALVEGRVDATLALLKNHAGLVSAWCLPLTLGLSASTTVGPAVLAAGVALGTLSAGATAVSLAKNIMDASRAETATELAAESEQILTDGLGLGLSGLTAAATSGIKGSVRMAVGKSIKAPSLPAPAPLPMPAPEAPPEAE